VANLENYGKQGVRVRREQKGVLGETKGKKTWLGDRRGKYRGFQKILRKFGNYFQISRKKGLLKGLGPGIALPYY